jgi:hypothetical protein
MDWNGTTVPHDTRTFLRYIHGAVEVIAVDTWVKTYSLMVDIPTTVIQTLHGGRPLSISKDYSAHVFLNMHLWPSLRVMPLETIINQINTSPR